MASTAKVVPIKKPLTIGQLIDMLADVEERRTKHAALGKTLDAEKTDIQSQIFATLDAQETLTGSSKTRRVSISSQEEPTTVDWEQGLEWMAKNKMLHLVQRRIGAPAWREVKAMAAANPKLAKTMTKVEREVDGQKVVTYEVPGFETFVVRKLSFTKV